MIYRPAIRGNLPCNKGVLPKAFTLLELVITILIVGILAVSIAPRLQNSSEIKPYAYRDQLISSLRHAQMQAMSDRSTNACYQVIVEPQQFGYDASNLGTCAASLPVAFDPDTTEAGAVISEDDITLTATDLSATDIMNADIRFNGLGQPSWLNSSGVEQSDCSNGCIINVDSLPVCIRKQGYISNGDCS